MEEQVYEMLASFKDDSDIVMKIRCKYIADALMMMRGYMKESFAEKASLFNNSGMKVMTFIKKDGSIIIENK